MTPGGLPGVMESATGHFSRLRMQESGGNGGASAQVRQMVLRHRGHMNISRMSAWRQQKSQKTVRTLMEVSPIELTHGAGGATHRCLMNGTVGVPAPENPAARPRFPRVRCMSTIQNGTHPPAR